MIVQKVINTFKTNYKNNIGMGIGDFLRGSFVLLHLCKSKNIEFDLDFSQHPISNLLINTCSDIADVNYDDVPYIHCCHNNEELWNFIVSLNSKEVYIFTNNYVTQDITDEEKKIIRDKFIPNLKLKEAINSTLQKLNLISHTYSVIHIRTGDKYLISGEKLKHMHINEIYDVLDKNMDKNTIYLVLSDNNELKSFLHSRYSNIISQVNTITHTVCSDNNDALYNTMVDFFLIANSNYVLSLSPYAHLSGFSRYCCIMNNIPYCGIKLSDNFIKEPAPAPAPSRKMIPSFFKMGRR
jgi:hypothetical protein